VMRSSLRYFSYATNANPPRYIVTLPHAPACGRVGV